MRILMVVDRYAPEARSAAHLFEDLAKELVRRGHAVSVLTKQPTENAPGGPAPARETRDGAAVRRLSSPLGEPRATVLKALDQALFAARVFTRLVAGPRHDVVLVYSPPLPVGVACAAAELVGGPPVVVNLHDIYPRTAIELGRLTSKVLIALAHRAERFLYRRARQLIVPAPGSVAYLTGDRGLPPEKVRLVYNWLDLDAATPGEGQRFLAEQGLEGRFVATYAGLVGIAQDLSALVSAAHKARDEADLCFLVIGEGSELERWKSAGEGLPNLRFVPTLPRDQYLSAIRASSVGLLALSQDLTSPAIPGKLQSLMALAKPVVAVVPADSAAAGAIEASGCGIVTKPGDGNALLAALRELRADPQRGAAMGAAGRRFAEARFSLSAAAGEFERAFSEAAARR